MFNCEFDELPEHIVQRIQFFLTGKEAAQTIILSKSWYKAWLTRPNLDFDESDFSNTNSNEFSVLAKKTIQRYEDSNLKIESFRLFLQNHNYENYELANILIVKALKLCASHLCFELEEELGGYPREFKFIITREVFESENLFGLSVKGCRIDIGIDHIVRCCKLESLSLSSVKIENKAVISNIISSCPFIRNLSLSNLSEKQWYRSIPINLPKLHNLKCLVLSSVELDTLFFRDMSSNFPSLRDLTLQNWPDKLFTFDVGTNLRLESLSLSAVHIESHMISKIVLSCPSIENLSLSYVYGTYPISFPKLHKLKCLTLCWVKLDTLFFDDLSTKFPALKDLTLDELFKRDDPDQEKEEIRISSPSLERLNLLYPCDGSSMFKLDVPNIQKFVIEACSFPSVSFKSTSKEWESHVSINYGIINPLCNAWFLVLNEFLTALSPSNIHLSIHGYCTLCFDHEVRDIQGLPQPRVENLNVDIQFLPSLNSYALFDGLFRICRPQFITQYQFGLDSRPNINDFLFKRLEQGVNGEFSSPGDLMNGLHDLKEVCVPFFDDGVVADVIEASESTRESKKKSDCDWYGNRSLC